MAAGSSIIIEQPSRGAGPPRRPPRAARHHTQASQDPMPPELSRTPCEFTVKGRMAGKRIDAYLSSRFPEYSRSVMQKVIDAQAVLVNGHPVKASYKVHPDDAVRVWLP